MNGKNYISLLSRRYFSSCDLPNCERVSMRFCSRVCELLAAFKRDRKCKERYHSLHSLVYQYYFFWRGKEEIAWQRERISSAFSFSILFLPPSLHFSRKGKNSVEKREGRLCTPSDFNAISPRKRESAALLESALAKCQNATLQNG